MSPLECVAGRQGCGCRERGPGGLRAGPAPQWSAAPSLINTPPSLAASFGGAAGCATLEPALSHRQLVGTLAGRSHLGTQVSPIPLAGAFLCAAVGVPDACGQVVGAQALPEPPVPPNPLPPSLGSTHSHCCSPAPGTQLSPPGSPWPGCGVGSRRHRAVLPISAGSGCPRHQDLPPPSVLSPGPPRGLRCPIPAPRGSPQPSRQFCRVVWAGRASSVAGAALSRCCCLCRHHRRFLQRCPRAAGTATDTPANDEFLLLRSLESPHVQRGTPLTHDLDVTAPLHTMTQPRAPLGRYVTPSRTCGHPCPPLSGDVSPRTGLSLIRGHRATRALLGIILGNPASRCGLNTSRASQNKTTGGSWVTRAVTQGCATDNLHVRCPLPSMEKHRWRGPGRG